jgi:hypothetical protein
MWRQVYYGDDSGLGIYPELFGWPSPARRYAGSTRTDQLHILQAVKGNRNG